MNDHDPVDQIDANFRDWAAAVRAGTPAVSMPQYQPPGRRRSLAVTAVVLLILLVSVGVAIVVGHRQTVTPATGSVKRKSFPSGSIVGSGHVHDYVLRDGDTVRGVGEILALPGRAVRFCDPLPFLDNATVSAGDPYFRYCADGVDLHSADLTNLAGRKQQGDKIYGFAQLTGKYRHHTLTVTHQIATTPARDQIYTDPPCSPPAGGWSTTYRSLDPIRVYKRSHPAKVIEIAYLLPSRHHRVPYVITAGATGPVRTALTPAYGTDLCVARSRYTRQQLDSANTKMKSLLLQQTSPGSLTALTAAGGIDLDRQAQPDVPAEVAVVSRNLATAVDALPQGIVQLQVWLTPKT